MKVLTKIEVQGFVRMSVCVCVCKRSYVRITLPELMLGPYQGTACTTAASTTSLCIKHQGNKEEEEVHKK